MNPLRIAETLREDYLRLLRTTFNPRQEELRRAFIEQISHEGFLTREPFIALAQPHRYGRPLTELLPETLARFGAIAENPYQHQAEACRRILRGEPAVVATGTGSGKTEAFLMPIVDHCLRDRQPGLKAILIYPMNALANDQRDRIRDLVRGTGVSFGVYTGETRLRGPRPADAPAEEQVNRQEFRASPPDLLLTNYQMLEYLLIRGDGRDIFRDHRVRFVVLDEVHTYHGALGTDVALLLRRLRAALERSRPDAGDPLFIGTSATLHAGEGEDPRDGVASFFTGLTGQPTGADSVITEASEAPAPPAGLTLAPPPAITEEMLRGVDPADDASVLPLARALASRPGASLVESWEGTLLPYLLMDLLRSPRPLHEVAALLGKRPERHGVAPDALRREVEAALLVGQTVPDDRPLRLRPRVHRFLRGLARFWRCTNPDHGRLLREGEDACPDCDARALPLALCRTCGWDFFMAVGPTDRNKLIQVLRPWPGRASTKRTVFAYDPPPAPVDVDPEDDPTVSAAEDDGPPDDEDEGQEVSGYLCPECLTISEDQARRLCAHAMPLRPIRLQQGRGSRCPICRSRYGRFDVLGPVSLGNSLALTHAARSLLRRLPDVKQKLLVFTDSRQDAAHQYRFIQSVEDHLKLRRAVNAVLRGQGPHDLTWLVEHLYEEYVRRGWYERTRQTDVRARAMDELTGNLLKEFVIAATARPSLERLGLVRVGYAGLPEDIEGEDFEALCRSHALPLATAQTAALFLLHLMRRRRAVSHDALRTRLYRNDPLVTRYKIIPGRQVGVPVAFLLPGSRAIRGKTYVLETSWGPGGSRTAAQALWIQSFGARATPESLDAVLRWLLDRGFLRRTHIGRGAGEAEGLMVDVGALQFEEATSFFQCSVCGHVETNLEGEAPCPRYECGGRLRRWVGAVAEQNLNALLVTEDYAPVLRPAEHSAAVTDEIRQKVERGFDSEPPLYNVLACTPTLELGVNIGDLEVVALRNIPPRPANYAQRVGRTGRKSRMGVAAGFARNVPHDGYFFDHPGEMITGAIAAPRFNLSNLEAAARHIRSLALEAAQIEFGADLSRLLSEEGALAEAEVNALAARIQSALPAAKDRARDVFAAIPGITGEWIDRVIDELPAELRGALERRGRFIQRAVEKMRELGTRVNQTPADRANEQGYRVMANKLRLDYRYAYLPRVLAEEGLLPGYAFPGDPGSLSLGLDPEPIFANRLQAQREYCPGQIVYARGERWKVKGLALDRPGSLGRTRGQERFSFTVCPACGLANPSDGANNCLRCNTALDGASLTAIDAGAFQAWKEDVEAESEEERALRFYDVRPHPQQNVPGRQFGVGDWRLALRRQEDIWWINHGPVDQDLDGGPVPPSARFNLCLTCGEVVQPVVTAPPPRGRRRQAPPAPQAARDPHADRCSGTPEPLAIGHQARGDTLRLLVPGLDAMGPDGVTWACSIAQAVLQGAAQAFEIDEDDLDWIVLSLKTSTPSGGTNERVLEVVWVDRVLGGSGILEQVARRFNEVAAAAVRHLEGHDCERACYRCLMTYRNQRWHHSLNWRFVFHHLQAAAHETVVDLGEVRGSPHVTEGPEWDEARREGCESPVELRLLQAMRAAGLPEPEKQYRVEDDQGRHITDADFAYPDQRLLIYVDGLAFHSSLRRRLHDTRQRNKLQTTGFTVLTFLGADVTRNAARCADDVRVALEAGVRAR